VNSKINNLKVIQAIENNDPIYPSYLKKFLAEKTPSKVFAIGNPDILQSKTLAVFCSNKCPGNIILKTYELLRQLRERGITVISGFHSAMERECLNILLKGRRPSSYALPAALRECGLNQNTGSLSKMDDYLYSRPFQEKKNVSLRTGLLKGIISLQRLQQLFSSPMPHQEARPKRSAESC
jgi:hypothetical protein